MWGRQPSGYACHVLTSRLGDSATALGAAAGWCYTRVCSAHGGGRHDQPGGLGAEPGGELVQGSPLGPPDCPQ